MNPPTPGLPPLSFPQIWEFPFGDALVLARPDFHGLYILNPSAALLWQSLRRSPSTVEAVSRLVTHYGISEAAAQSDVDAAVAAWSETILNAAYSPAASPPSSSAPPQTPFSFVSLYRINGKVFEISIAGADLEEEIAPRLEHLQTSAASPDFHLQVFRAADSIHVLSGPTCIASEAAPSGARIILLDEIVRLSCPGVQWLTVLHAGACGNGSEAILFPAATHSGKTTLAAALMEHGLTFYSDDSAPIHSKTLEVVAMPFALMIREGSWNVLQSRYPQMQSRPVFARTDGDVRYLWPNRNQSAPTAARVKALVFTKYEPASPSTLAPLDPFESLLALQQSGFWLAHDRESIAAFLTWIESLPAYKLNYSDLDQAVSRIELLLSR